MAASNECRNCGQAESEHCNVCSPDDVEHPEYCPVQQQAEREREQGIRRWS
jgi:hypothetical protein